MTVGVRRLLALALLPVALAAASCGEPPDGAGDPDAVPAPPFVEHAATVASDLQGVVMIVVDTLRADHLGAYGSTEGLTPNIDALAERSHLFEQAVAASSWTRPAIAAMLTSRYPTSLGLLDKQDSLSDEAVTIAEVLRNQAGFQTLAVITNGNVSEQWGFGQGFDRFVWPHLRRRYPGDFPIHVAEGVTQRALGLLDERDPRRPFFLFVLFVDPHDPYLPHPELEPGAAPAGRFDGSREQLHELDRLRLRANREDYDRIRHLYAGEVRYVDHWIGRFLDGLEERGLTDEVIIALTADHGEGLWSHGLRGHGNDLYEESVHVPLLLRYPGTTEAEARRIGTPVSLVDLAPTLLSAARAPKPSSFQGFDLGPLTRGESRGAAFDYVYAEMDHRGRNFEALRSGDWKLIRKRDDRSPQRIADVQLFDLDSDPEERRNLAKDVRVPARARLARSLEGWHLAVLGEGATRHEVALSELGRSTLENLRALGYVGEVEIARAKAGPAVDEAGPRELDGRNAPSDSSIDLASTGSAHPQVVSGFAPAAAGATWISGEASVWLRRAPTHEKWVVEIEAKANGGFPLVFEVVAGDGDPTEVEIGEPGLYALEGPLPAEDSDSEALRIDLRCRRPSMGPDGACTPIRALSLR